MQRGNLAIAESEMAKARRSRSIRNSQWDSKYRILEARIFAGEGNSQKVLEALHPAACSSTSDIKEAIQSATLCALAYARLGQSQRADQELAEAQSLSDSNHAALSEEIFFTRGLIDLHYERFSSAEGWLQKSLEISRLRGDKFLEADTLLDLGVVALESERYDEALRQFRRASDLAASIQFDNNREIALENQGWAYYYLGDFEKAFSTFQQAEKQAETLGTRASEMMTLDASGLCLLQMGELDAAERFYQRALKSAQAIEDRKEVGHIHLDLGFLYLQQDRIDLAQQHSDAALRAARELASKPEEAGPLFLQALIAARQRVNPEAIRALMQVEHTPEIEASLQWRVQNAIANQYSASGQLHQAEYWYRKSLQTFEAQRSTLKDDDQKLPFFANADSLYKDYADFLIQSHRGDQALMLLDAARARTLEDGLGLTATHTDSPRLKPVSLTSPRQPLPAISDPRTVARKLCSTILFYSLGPQQSHLWAVNSAGIHSFDLPPQAEIEKAITAYQKAILRGDDLLRQPDSEASYLYDKLVAPAAIKPGSRVIIVPDGPLSLLNFETFVKLDKRDQQGAHYWIEDVTVTNASSIRLLSASCAGKPAKSQALKSRKLLLLGDAASPAPDYPSLANAPVEVSSVAKHFSSDSRRILTKANATPAAYKNSSPDQFDYIHFVAHATASRLSPLDSAVVLSASQSQPDKYKLYARDILQQPLHAELVVISSCYGSGSREYAGEGLVGLSWAFLRAGSHHVISALWAADDASTSRLMDRLYGKLDSGERADDALRDAKLTMIHSTGIYRKPFYWAPFQLQSGS
jgi:CHAT domain-containing protein/tetratricopeptide (TPR) repeat protein